MDFSKTPNFKLTTPVAGTGGGSSLMKASGADCVGDQGEQLKHRVEVSSRFGAENET